MLNPSVLVLAFAVLPVALDALVGCICAASRVLLALLALVSRRNCLERRHQFVEVLLLLPGVSR